MLLAEAGRARVPVWAPAAGGVELVLADRRIPMEAEKNGWWVAPTALADGIDYSFSIDGGPPLPDPRSARLPGRIHGPSRTWSAPSSVPPCEGGAKVLGGVIYELHVGTFTPEGTFQAAAAKLPLLKDLGVSTVELMPVASFDSSHGWGYDGVCPYSVHEAYGGPDGLIEFVCEAHKIGLAVCIDLVLNHLGPVGNYLAKFGPYFTERHSTPWGDGLNLDDSSTEVPRQYLVGAALRLFSVFGVDALRLDAVHQIKDNSEVHLLQELSVAVKKLSSELGRSLTLIAESDLNDVSMVRPVSEGGMGMDGQWDDDIHHALHVTFTGEQQGYYKDFADPGALCKVYEQVFYHDGSYSSFRGKNWGRPAGDVERWRFVACTQNHDQIGNRARGDRPNLTLAQAGSQGALLLLSPFTPLLFMGQEWHTKVPFTFFTSFSDPTVAQSVSAGRAREFAHMGWDEKVPDPQDLKTRDSAVLDWQNAALPAGLELRAFYKKLIVLRNDFDLANPSKPTRLQASANQIVLDRAELRLVVNRGNTDLFQYIPANVAVLPWQAHLDRSTLRLPPWSAAVLYRL